MSMVQTGYYMLFQANFPKSQAGKLSDVYYTIYNSDGSIHTARTNSGIVELGAGSYGVKLSFLDESNWSIWWDIDSTPYVASEEINAFNYRSVVDYDGYGL